MLHQQTLTRAFTFGCVAALLAACSSSSEESSGPGGTAGGFQLTSISVPNNSVWPLNRRVEFVFNQAVDFSSINASSIYVASLAGKPALGDFFVKSTVSQGVVTTEPNVIVWQPRCPTLPDLSDAGLDAGGVTYQILVQGQDSGGIAVSSKSGKALANSQARFFATPTSTNPNALFFDPVAGGPTLVVRVPGSTSTDASYLEIGDDANQVQFFELAFDQMTGEVIPLEDAPINLLSDSEQSVAVVLEFNQPLSPQAGNISLANLGLQVQNPGTLLWSDIPVEIELEANCTKAGARVRLSPIGILAQDSLFRVRVGSGLQDLVGEAPPAEQSNAARFATGLFSVPGLEPVGDLADELFEPFLINGAAPGSLEDTTSVFAEPRALWGAGQLAPNFNFLGTGGPGGNFDLEITGTFSFNTVSQLVTGGPGFAPTTTQTATNGLLNVRNLRIAQGAVLQVQGANPLRIFATGTVEILGTINVDGINAVGVNQLNVPNIPDPGAPGRAGGGRGGAGSPVTTASSPKGEDGAGAFGAAGLGGKGGETSFGALADTARRGAGGGGGRFAADVNAIKGFATGNATAGANGTTGATGAISKSGAAAGGQPGPSAFFDSNNDNDFFGVRQVDALTLVQGELSSALAGSGGGGGGDSINSDEFPQPGWPTLAAFAKEFKGAGGGGGGGQLQVFAIGNITIGATGRIFARGGDGGRGENTGGNNSIGGSSGGAAGGHIILQTAANFVSLSAPAGAISTAGGAGGPNASQSVGLGGRGGAGIVQIHTQTQANIVGAGDVPLTLAAINNLCRPQPWLLLPDFGRISKARSKFVALGGANQNPGSSQDQVLFDFEGTDSDPMSPTAGEVLRNGATVQPVAPILGLLTDNNPQDPGFTTPISIDTVARRIVIDASGLVDDDNDPQTPFFNDIYLRNTALLREFGVRLSEPLGAGLSLTRTFTVAQASYDPDLVQLTLDVDSTGGPLTGFTPGVASLALVPRFFRVITGGVLDSLPLNSAVTIRFEARAAGPDGQPDLTGDALVEWTSDIEEFNSGGLGADVGFFRFEVEFNLDVQGTGISANSPRPSLRFLRVPFRF